MRKNLSVFPHWRVGFADAPALFPVVGIIEVFSWQRRVDEKISADGRSNPA